MDDWAGDPATPPSLNKYGHCLTYRADCLDPTGHFMLIDLSVSTAIRASIASLAFGSIRAYFSIRNGLRPLEAASEGIKAAAKTGLAYVAWPYGLYLLGEFGYSVVTGGITTDDLPEIGSYVVAGIILHVTFKRLPMTSAGPLTRRRFAQSTCRESFSDTGAAELSKLTGKSIRSISDLTKTIDDGVVDALQIPVNYVVREGNVLIANTRTAQALERAGIPRSNWTGIDRTGDPYFEQPVTNQLHRNALTSGGTSTVTSSGP